MDATVTNKKSLLDIVNIHMLGRFGDNGDLAEIKGQSLKDVLGYDADDEFKSLDFKSQIKLLRAKLSDPQASIAVEWKNQLWEMV